MKILVNFAPLKSGGGQNVGMNFLLGLAEMDLNDIKLEFLVARGSAIHRYLCESGKYRYYVAPQSPIARIIYERGVVRRIILRQQIDIVYTYFGYGLFGRDIIQVCGSADSNIYFPEVHFWRNCHGFCRISHYLVDSYRIWGVKNAAAVVFENEAMRLRGQELLGLRRTKLIKPSIRPESVADRFMMPDMVPMSAYKVLFLCGWQENKNIMSIPAIAAEVRSRQGNVHFVLTAPLDGSAMQRRFLAELNNLRVTDMVTITGVVDKTQIASLYAQVDCVMLLSQLESFSNNIIEAWHFRKPLVVSSLLWAYAICKDAAIYVDRDSPTCIAEKLMELARNPQVAQYAICAGTEELALYPIITDRIAEELRYLKHVLAEH